MKFLSSGHAKAFGQPQSSNGTGNGAADRATWLSNGSRYVSYTSVTGKFFLACGEPAAPTYLMMGVGGGKKYGPSARAPVSIPVSDKIAIGS